MKVLDMFKSKSALEDRLAAIRREKEQLNLEYGFSVLAIEEGDTSPAALQRKDRASANMTKAAELERTLEASIRAYDAREAAKKVSAAEKLEAERQQRRDEIEAARPATARDLDTAIDQLAAAWRAHLDPHTEMAGLNPPTSFPLPNGLPVARLLRIIEFRLRYRDGMGYAPFRTLEESTVAYYFPAEKE